MKQYSNSPVIMCMSFIVAGVVCRCCVVSGSVPTSLHQVTHLKLPCDTHWKGGMNKLGDILLGDFHTDELYMCQNGNYYFKKWAKKCPDEFKSYYTKCINSQGDLFLQNDCDMETICYDNHLQKQYSVHHKGELIDSIDGELFYLERFEDDQYKIVAHKGDQSAGSASHKAKIQKEDFSKPLTLLPQWTKSARFPSVCRVQQYYVMVEGFNRAMDVFGLKGLFYWLSIVEMG